MDTDLNQELADLTIKLIDTHPVYAATVNDARNALTDLNKKFEYYELETPRPESIGQGHRIIIMMKAEIDRLKKELEDAERKISDLSWVGDTHQMGS